MILEPRDPQAKGVLERCRDTCGRTSSRGGGSRTTSTFRPQLDAWTDKANGRLHRTIRAVPAERLTEERADAAAARSDAGRRPSRGRAGATAADRAG